MLWGPRQRHTRIVPLNMDRRRSALALLAMATAIAVAMALGQGACGGGGGGGGAAFDAGADARPDRQADHPVPAADVAGETNEDVGIPEGAPPGWVPLAPVAPTCRIVLSPDPAHANPAPTWTSCGEGCTQFEVPNPDTWTGIKHAFGASRDGVRYIAFDNYSGATDQVESKIIRLPDNTVVFDGILFGQKNGCTFVVDAMSSEAVLLEGFYQAGSNGLAVHLSRFAMKPGESMPHLVFDADIMTVDELSTVSTDLWAVAYAGGRAMQWHDLSFATEASPGWSTPDGRVITGMQAMGSTIFFNTVAIGRFYGTSLWNPTDGVKPLVEYPSIDQGGACCVHTDGTDMIWFEGSGWKKELGDPFTEVWATTSPFVTAPAALQPRKLHRAYQNYLTGGAGVVGSGLALTQEGQIGSADIRLVLTRLSDGAVLAIPALPSGYIWGKPLYVDQTEFAVWVMSAGGPDHFTRPMSIRRQTIAALGPFQQADASRFEPAR